MEHVANLGTDFQELPALDPCCTVRQADLALLNRRREEAAALITQAYLAFDLVLADCDDVTGLGRV